MKAWAMLFTWIWLNDKNDFSCKDELQTHTSLIEKLVSSWFSRVEEFIVALVLFIYLDSFKAKLIEIWNYSMNKNDFISLMDDGNLNIIHLIFISVGGNS